MQKDPEDQSQVLEWIHQIDDLDPGVSPYDHEKWMLMTFVIGTLCDQRDRETEVAGKRWPWDYPEVMEREAMYKHRWDKTVKYIWRRWWEDAHDYSDSDS